MFFAAGGRTQAVRARMNETPVQEESKPQSDKSRKNGGKNMDLKMAKSKDSNVNSFCSVCRAKNQGLVAMCLRCGHGGHLKHIQEWFGDLRGNENRHCAIATCECHCVFVEGN